ncbi:MAG: hypothetical protein E7463_02430 [Ruminococcaceae bacterium]|nr:hypothetical protein [Oscillospiraceae bacterium]
MGFGIIDGHFHIGAEAARWVDDVTWQSALALMDRLDIERAISANLLIFPYNGCRMEEGLAIDADIYEKSGHRIYTYFGYHPGCIEKSLKVIYDHAADPQCVGIKIHPNNSRVFADDESFRPVWEAARELNLPIMSHTWDTSTYNPGQKYAFTGLFEKYIREYPDVTFIFGHSGGRYNGIRTAVDIGMRYPNACFDIGGDIWPNGFLEELVEKIGADRILYGSDYTMIEQRPMLGVVFGSSISNLDKEKILRHTAARIFFHEE